MVLERTTLKSKLNLHSKLWKGLGSPVIDVSSPLMGLFKMNQQFKCNIHLHHYIPNVATSVAKDLNLGLLRTNPAGGQGRTCTPCLKITNLSSALTA